MDALVLAWGGAMSESLSIVFPFSLSFSFSLESCGEGDDDISCPLEDTVVVGWGGSIGAGSRNLAKSFN